MVGNGAAQPNDRASLRQRKVGRGTAEWLEPQSSRPYLGQPCRVGVTWVWRSQLGSVGSDLKKPSQTLPRSEGPAVPAGRR